MDVMQKPKRFNVGYSIGFLYAYLGLTIPHSVAVNLAYPTEIPVNGATNPVDVRQQIPVVATDCPTRRGCDLI
jgi:hypothetical protein